MDLKLGVFAVVTLLLSGCGGAGSSTATGQPTSPLRAAYDACVPKEIKYLKRQFHEDAPFVTDEMNYRDGSLLITTPGPQGDLLSAAAFHATQCVLTETKAPPSIVQAMESTTALTGRQKDIYLQIKIGWSFNGSSPSSFEASFDPTT